MFAGTLFALCFMLLSLPSSSHAASERRLLRASTFKPGTYILVIIRRLFAACSRAGTVFIEHHWTPFIEHIERTCERWTACLPRYRRDGVQGLNHQVRKRTPIRCAFIFRNYGIWKVYFCIRTLDACLNFVLWICAANFQFRSLRKFAKSKCSSWKPFTELTTSKLENLNWNFEVAETIWPWVL